ncbi:L-ribulose-5-phosphate 4-epimerase [Paenisporosarcina sp. HGH0030]|uniref:L-fuculose-phosphate aldolase n=1 Tax=Paenisporosarcina sp. HGH0030 TaxID=1078085 RepID=UPI00034EBACD|nr:L-fuculose-phosphate aldolase [Paenisporosarcina sp. HGH0030]EPD51916.1 L-ribulose-5-phosphate 4-epimerase [Paenisporosarcina sp. HGH0030]
MFMKERNEIVDYCKLLRTRGLTKGTGGNISIFDRESGHMIISPSGIDYDIMTAEDVVVCNLQGEVIAGDKKPSSEFPMHAIFYQQRTDIDAIVHTHSMHATVLASLRWNLPAVSYLVAYAGKDVRCAEYASFGTSELATNAFEGMKGRQAVLLANHGLLAGANNIATAFAIAEEIEFCCEVYLKAKAVGEPVILDDNEMAHMAEKFKSYGQK